MGKLKITKGEWKIKTNIHPSLNGNPWGWIGKDQIHQVDKIPGVNVTWEEGKESEANAKLIADAGNTANKCGKLPSELLEERDQLLEAITGLLNIIDDSQGVAGYHLNGNIALWNEFTEVDQAEQLITKIK